MTTSFIQKSTLVSRIGTQLTHMPLEEIKLSVNIILKNIRQALCEQKTISIRGFGTLKLVHHPERQLYHLHKNTLISIPARLVPRFKPGKALQKNLL